MQPLEHTTVLIVGGGPAGLALAIELGHRGVPCLLVERNDRVGYAPRAKTTNARTREHMRRWGIASQLRAASPLGVDYPSNVVFVTRLGGHELARFDNALWCAPGKNPLYAEHSQWIPQYRVEEVMKNHAQALPGVILRFNTELVGFTQDAEGVTATLRDHAQGGASSTVRARFLVGSDGARSRVREAIGAHMEGTHSLSRNYNVVFRSAGLEQAHRHGPGVMFWQVNPDVPSIIGPMERDPAGDKWFFMPTGVPPGVKFEPNDAPALIRRATGIDLPYAVLSSDEWTASRLIATHYRQGRIFLVGDACHLHPPFGGHGMNMGVGDSVDLGWKLAAVLQGWGGAALLDSYAAERRPVHEMVMDEAVANHGMLTNQLWRDGLEDADAQGEALRTEVGRLILANKNREYNWLGVVLGYHYAGSPVIAADGTPTPAHDYWNYVPSSRPGHRAPHAWLHDGSSLYDHFGWGFTLLAWPGAPADALAAAQQAARGAGVPLQVLQPSEGAIPSLYRTCFTLIRPDQHVAWRGNAFPADLPALFRQLTGR